MIPTSIDGTDITGATIDGTDVTEITVDGDTVFTAETLPVAYSNLVAWWPFDSSFYGGSVGDDVTALFNPAQSGDSTAYDVSDSSGTSFSPNDVVDINAGANSTCLRTDGSSDCRFITSFGGSVDTFSIMGWLNKQGVSDGYQINQWENPSVDAYAIGFRDGKAWYRLQIDDGQGGVNVGGPTININNNEWYHIALARNGNNGDYYFWVDGVLIANGSTITGTLSIDNNLMFGNFPEALNSEFDGFIDDVRLYNAELTTSQVQQIVDNTKPPSKP